MATTPTNTPIPSELPRDLKFNAGKIDEFVNALTLKYIDRFGLERFTVAGLENLVRQIVSDLGLVPFGTFEDGATLTNATQSLKYSDNNYYRWDGDFPKVVAAGSSPDTTGGVSRGAWVNVTDLTLRGELSELDGYNIIGSANYNDIRGYSGVAENIMVYGRSSLGDGGDGVFRLDYSDEISIDDDGTVIIDVLGRRWKRQYSGAVNVVWFGAKAGDDTAPTALSNTDAFRRACLSIKTDWDAWRERSKKSRSVYVPAGDYNLSNGFTVPKGCSIYSDGVGVARLKILSSTVDTSAKLPLISLGSVIDDSSVVASSGAYVQDPAPSIDKIYLNPQNSNTAVDINGIPGFHIGSLWIQADTGIAIRGGSGDGIIESVFAENGTSRGIVFADCQNITVDNLYTFLCSNPVVHSANNNNTIVKSLQSNYTKVAVVQVNDGVTVSGAKVGILVSKTNEQFSTFTSVIRCRGTGCDISINEMDARNYNGYATNNETGLNNSIRIGRLTLRQSPQNSTDTAGTNARGCRVNNSDLIVDSVNIGELGFSPFSLEGTFQSKIYVSGGVISGLNATVPVVDISNTSTSSICEVQVEPPTGLSLFNLQQYISPKYDRVRKPFPTVTESGRLAIKIPFIGNANTWRLSIRANTNAAGNANYRRVRRLFVAQETGFVSSAVVTNVAAVDDGNTALSTAFTPDVSYQLDVDSVGNGSQKAYKSYGYVVISTPSTYSQLTFDIQKEI